MNILMITENDPAGMGIAFKKAINTYTSHQCRLITKTTRYNFDFEKDLHLPDFSQSASFDALRELLGKADIIHFHILADENMELGPLKVKDFIKGKILLHHHHGHPDFRANPEKYRRKYRKLKRQVLVSTPDLLRMIPEATWQPNLVPVHDMLMVPVNVPVNGTITVGQSVTRKDIKNTEDLLEAVAAINGKQLNPIIEAEIIENMDYQACLRRKQRCHVIFDHMQGYYGVSSLESFSQGRPVIAGLDEFNISQIRNYFGVTDLPWVIARNREELKFRLVEISRDTSNMEILGCCSRRFMVEVWSDRFVAERLSEFYLKL